VKTWLTCLFKSNLKSYISMLAGNVPEGMLAGKRAGISSDFEISKPTQNLKWSRSLLESLS
jgi:hypothetical protein